MIVRNDMTLALHISAFLGSYLPMQRGVSENTICTYRDAYRQLLLFLSQEKGIKPTDAKLADMSRQIIEEYLGWAQKSRSTSDSTWNNRLAAIKSFFRYISFREPAALDICAAILEMQAKKTEAATVKYITIEAYRFLLSVFDVCDRKQLRAISLIALMYESGGRVSEIAGIRSSDLRMGKSCNLVLHGKGRKTRIVPIDASVGKLVQKYKERFSVKDDEYLFFNSSRKPLTREGISHILQTYFKVAKERRPELFPDTISPHCLRHSKAMHLLENNVNIIYIRDLLGHESVTTTEIYAKTNPEAKRKHIEEASKMIAGNSYMYSQQEEDSLLEWIKSMF